MISLLIVQGGVYARRSALLWLLWLLIWDEKWDADPIVSFLSTGGERARGDGDEMALLILSSTQRTR